MIRRAVLTSSDQSADVARAADEEIAAWSELLATTRKVRRVVAR